MRRAGGVHARRAATLLLAMAVTLSAGCAAVRRPPATLEALRAAAPAAREAEERAAATVAARLAERAARRGDGALDLLLLSGGGQHGAYGAGFLRGWRSREADPMPRFDLVTGVSTGALQSLFAFRGSEVALDSAAALYRGAAESFAPRLDWLFWLRRTGGVVDVGRLRRTIAGIVDEPLCEGLRPEFAAGREIVVTTTDVDLGMGRSWLLSREMVGCGDRLGRVHDLLLASASIPGIFPPVLVDGHVHVDGGIAGNLAPVLGLEGYRALAEELRARGVGGQVTVRLWVVVNLWLDPRLAVTDPASRGGIGQRSTGLMFALQQRQMLTRLEELAVAVSEGVPGLRLEVRCTAVPSELADDPAAQRLFDAAWMARLEALGYERARGDSPWGCA